MRGFHSAAELGERKLKLIMDNCSAHAIDYSTYPSVDAIFLPPKMTLNLLPVDISIERCFKCSYSCLLMQRILKWVKNEMEKSPKDRRTFEPNK